MAAEEGHITRVELGGAVLVAAVLAIALTWPLVTVIDEDIPSGLVDPPLQSWEVAWGGHALLNQPAQYFDGNGFWPTDNNLAFSDALIGYAPVGLLGKGPGAALIRYNVLFLFAYALAFVGAYLLARELGAPPLAAMLAGVAFAYAPWRLSQSDHLNILSSGGIPLSLFLLTRGYRRRRPGLVLAGWAVATWQVSLGFSLGLQLIYALGALGILWLAVSLWRRTVPVPRALAPVTAVGIAVLATISVLLALPYLRTLDEHPQARRSIEEVEFFSPPKKGLLAAPEGNRAWGAATKPIRDALPFPAEQTLFPGLVVPALALVGLAFGAYAWGRSGRALRIGLAVGAVVTIVLSLGFSLAGGWLGYRYLYQLPGWQGVRTPGRISTITTLLVALLAAGGAAAIAARLRKTRYGSRIAPVVALILVALAAFEGSGRLDLERVPEPSPGIMQLPDPQFHLPPRASNVYLLWSTDGFPRIVNGFSGVIPTIHQALLRAMRTFPDEPSVELLESLDVRTIVLHLDLARGSPEAEFWERMAHRPVGGLPLRREERGAAVIYHVLSAEGGS